MDFSSQSKGSSKRWNIIRIIVDVTIWFSASVVAVYLFLYGKPYERGFFCDDESLSYPSVKETISTPVLVSVCLAVSILLEVSVEAFNYLDNKCRPRYQRVGVLLFCVKSYIVFMIGFLIQELFVDAIKNKVGVLRPNFFDVCKPQFNTTLCPGYISEYTCTGSDDKEIRNSRQSFPSGHSSLAMYIAVYFSIYIEHRLQIWFSRLLKLLLQAGLILVAILCGLGRIRENKHHPSDVIAGFILGTAVAILVHTMLWKRYVKEVNIKETNRDTNRRSRDCFCSSERPSEYDLQATSTLQNEYIRSVDNDRNSSSTKLFELNDNNQNIVVTTECI